MTYSNSVETMLWLLRHPEPEGSVRGRCYGSLDVALSPEGISNAHRVADVLNNQSLATIYTSPRQRCLQAAAILAAGRPCPVVIEDALQEMDCGDFEGRSYDEIATLYPNPCQHWMEHPTEPQFPGGESFPEMRTRVLDAATRIRSGHDGQSVALVTHGGVIRLILAEALGMEPASIFRIGQRYGAVNLIRYFGETPLVELVNTEGNNRV